MPASSDSAVDSELEAALYAAIEAGELPNTELSKLVFKNSMRFPDAIVLTRVGKFYESYFAPAIHLADVLNLRLA
ncbi:MAG: DNA mismatch repair ATPase msh1 [Tremellales sp. Tagirdzhanova-0007]|nr:MAG: DNA mismatch repair ATPase msh1 [Tremellales sp. Tagirdzhanova-0007]